MRIPGSYPLRLAQLAPVPEAQIVQIVAEHHFPWHF